jgi:hypothetical protein
VNQLGIRSGAPRTAPPLAFCHVDTQTNAQRIGPEPPWDAAGRASLGPGRPIGYSLLVHLSCGLQSLGIGIWRGFCYAIEAAENREAILTPCDGNIEMHRTGVHRFGNASQVPVNTGDSKGRPSLMDSASLGDGLCI